MSPNRPDDLEDRTLEDRTPDDRTPDDVVGDDRTVTLSQERLVTGTETVQSGAVRARKTSDTERVSRTVERSVEHAEVDRGPALEADSGQVETLPDGSLSIPVFEEQLVVEKRMVVRERVIVRKHTVYEDQEVTVDLRRERLEVEVDGNVEVDDRTGRSSDS